MMNTPSGPMLLGFDVIWIGTILVGVAAADGRPPMDHDR